MALRLRRPRVDAVEGRERAGQRGPAVPPVAVVTDSTASLPAGAARRWRVDVVPLEVALGTSRYREGVDLDTEGLLAALSGGTSVTTSQPSPAAFARAYADAAARGAREVVSVHLSGDLSGTVRAAELAARESPVPVHVVDSRTVAMALGFAVLSAAHAAGGPGDDGQGARPGGAVPVGPGGAGAAVAERARAVAASSQVLFVVEGLEHLRRGGRIGGTAAAVGGLLGMRPLLTVRDGRVEVAGTVRTRRAARERLLDTVAAEVARQPGSRVAVHHLARPDTGEELAAALRDRLGAPGGPGGGPEVVVAEVSAVVGAHAGPGLLGVVVAGP